MKVLMKASGKIEEVAAGYARNYLIPRGLAEVLSQAVLDKQREKVAEDKAARAKQKAADEAKAKALDGTRLKFVLKTNKTGKLHGSVTQLMIAKKLKVKKEAVRLSQSLKKEGRYPVKVKLGQSVAQIELEVAAKKG